MKKFLSIMLAILLLSMSFVYADNSRGNRSNPDDDDISPYSEMDLDNNTNSGLISPAPFNRTPVYKHSNESIKEDKNAIIVQNTETNKTYIFTKEKDMERNRNMTNYSWVYHEGNISYEGNKYYYNGKEVKIMPDTASQRAIEVLEANKNVTVLLKDSGERLTPVYEVEAKKDVKVLGFIKTEMKVKAEVDADSGEVIKEDKPWWAFLAKEKKLE